MPHRAGMKHGIFGAVSILLAIKLVIKKGLFVADEVIRHQFLHLPLEILLVDLPVSIFGTVGGVLVDLTGTSLPAEGVGLVILYPLFVAAITAVIHTPSLKTIGSYWLGATLVTGFAVSASVGLAPDPGGVGSGIAYHLHTHTVAMGVQDAVLMIGEWVSAVGSATIGRPIDDTIGLLLAGVFAAFCYGVVWELSIGHD